MFGEEERARARAERRDRPDETLAGAMKPVSDMAAKHEPTVRVLRVIEYIGTREFVARSLAQSIQGTMRLRDGEIRTATLGDAADFLRGAPLDPRSIARDPRS